jgi:hypothetical protein
MFAKILGLGRLHPKRVLRALSQRSPRPAIVVVSRPAWKTYRVRGAIIS